MKQTLPTYFYMWIKNILKTKEVKIMSKDFVIKDDVLIKYTGTDSIVKIPEGITTIKRSCFENNEYIKEIIEI